LVVISAAGAAVAAADAVDVDELCVGVVAEDAAAVAGDAAFVLVLLELLLPHPATMVAATTDIAAINFARFTVLPRQARRVGHPEGLRER
jgi:hypothetical protein